MNPVEPTPPVPVAIIGMGCLFPRAEGLSAYWSNIRRRRDAITEVPETHWRAEDYYDPDPRAPDRTYARRGGFLTPVDFPPLDFGIAPNNIDATDTTQLLGLMVARSALEDAGYGDGSPRPLDRSRVSVILGVTGTLELVIPLGARLGHPIWRRALKAAGVPHDTAEDVVKRIADSYVGWQENSFPGLLGNVAAGRIANRLDLGGTNCAIDAACASSVSALNLAILELATGRCDMALSGGLDTFNDIFMYMCFSKTPALSPRGDARPFDAGCDGTVLGEGLGILALKRLDDARRDGDKVYAVIRSVGSSSDGKGAAVYAPQAPGQAKALRHAYRLAGVSPATVELVEAHGTGTKVGDATEVKALTEVYTEARPEGTWCALGSVKSQIGHTKAAAGAAGIIKAALALHHKVLPPTIKVEQPLEGVSPGVSPFYVNTEARPWLPRPGHPRRAAVSAFGFGGSNYHCVLEEAEPAKAGIDWDGETQILAFSAIDHDALAAAVNAWPAGLDWPAVRIEAARSRARFRHDDPHRLVIVADRESDLASVLRAAASAARGETITDARLRSSVFTASGPVPGKLAMLFPGQGSQYVGMLRELACVFPAMQEPLAVADQVDGPADTRLSDRIYPFPAFTDTGRAAHEQALRATDCAQPAIGAVSLGVYRVLEHFGVRPDLVGGHSFGELTALCVAGRLDPKAFAALARERGRLMAAEAAAGAGAMLAVLAPLGEVEEVIREERLDLVIANKNAPRQFVLSGTTAAVNAAAEAFRRRKVSTRALPVSAAFHSPIVARASTPFLEALRGIELRPSPIAVYANTTAAPYPAGADEARALLAGQIARPVEFVAQVEAMARAGAAVFLEVGPDAKLSGLVRSTLEPGAKGHGTKPTAIAVDASRGERGNLNDLAATLAELAALGYPVELTRWDEGVETTARPARKPGLTVKVSGANAGPRPTAAEPATLAGSAAIAPTPAPARSVSPAPVPTPVSVRPAPVPQPAPPSKPAPHPPMSSPSTPAHPSHTNGAHHPARNGHADHPPHTSNGHPAVSDNGHVQTNPVPIAPIPIGHADAGAIAQALRTAQENLVALQRLAEQTSDIHRQFLEGQDRGRRTFQSLLEQQQRLTLATLGMAHVEPVAHAAPSPTPTAPTTTRVRTEPRVASVEQPAQVDDRPVAKAPLAAPVPVMKAVEPAPMPVAAPVPARPAPKINAASPVLPILLEVVAEKTGYPVDMLEPGMLLDADLGIDSIKRVEILSALQERLPEAPPVAPEMLGTLRTLQDIASYLGENTAAPEEPVVSRPAPTTAPASNVLPVLLEVVADKTGYPVDMLEPGMLLDADLGIDSIKRVEILSALQERLPEAPPVAPEMLGTLRTLQDIAAYLGEGVSDVPVAAGSAPTPVTPPDRPAPGVLPVLLEVVADKTGYPVDMLEPGMLLDADLGIDSIKRVEILSALQERLPEAPPVAPEQLGTLRTLQDIADYLAQSGSTPVSATPTPPSIPARTQAKLPALQRLIVEPESLPSTPAPRSIPIRSGGEVWVTDDATGLSSGVVAALARHGYAARLVPWDGHAAATAPAALDGLVLIAPTAVASDRAVADAFRWLRLTGSALRKAGKSNGAIAATVMRLDGNFGAGDLSNHADPAIGALAGLAKTAAHEWADVRCRAIDLDPSLGSADDAVSALVDELSRPGPVEVGLGAMGRTSPRLRPEPVPSATGTPPLRQNDLVLISGGARGVTAEVAVALAESFRPTLVLLGRSPAPQPEPDWLAPLHDETEIKRALATRANGHATPQLVGERFRALAAAREITRNLERIEAAGATAIYHSVDVRDPAAVREAVAALRSRYGPVRGLIHGAGVLADRRIDDQTDAQFAEVRATKVAGLRSLLSAIEPDDLRALALFSSSTGRFGRVGQVAYAAANEALNKIARHEARRRPGCRVVAVNWGPWDGGMVTDALKPLFAAEGVGLIDTLAGARYLVDELSLPPASGPTEVVILGGDSLPASLTIPTPPAPAAIETTATAVTTKPAALTTVFERTLEIESMPILRSHVIDGRAVLPMALILEWLAQGAVQRNPGLTFLGVDDLRVLKGVVLHEDRPETISVLVGKAVRGKDGFQVPVELRGTLLGGKSVAHARGTVILTDRTVEAPATSVAAFLLPATDHTPRSFYHDVLFHGPDLHGIERVEGMGPEGIAALVKTGPRPADWVENPLRQSWLSDPLAIDCAFQMMVAWAALEAGAPSLPTVVGRYRQFRRAFPGPRVRVLARTGRPAAHRATADIDFLDMDDLPVARLEGYECVIDASLQQAFRRNRLVLPQVARGTR